jgi:hypothetical protein
MIRSWCDSIAIGLFCMLVGNLTALADPSDAAKRLRQKVIEAKSSDAKAAAYQRLFESVGRKGLAELMKDPDTGIALQAAWEANTRPTWRRKHDPTRSDNIYDPAGLRNFVEFLRAHTKAPVPDWWATRIVEVERGRTTHDFPESARTALPPTKESDAGYFVPEGAELKSNEDGFVYTAHKLSIEFRKSVLEQQGVDSVAGLPGEKRSAIAPYQRWGAYEFKLMGFEGTDAEPSWKADVWGARRSLLLFGDAGHRVDLREKAGDIYVFGGESHGMYLEAFDAVTGRCHFRFCTCYWSHWSEEWGPKWPPAPSVPLPLVVELGPEPREMPPPTAPRVAPQLAPSDEHLTPKEEDAVRDGVYSEGIKIEIAAEGKWKGTRILVIPESVQKAYASKPKATVRLLLRIVDGGRPADVLSAAGSIYALLRDPLYAREIVRYYGFVDLDGVKSEDDESHRQFLLRSLISEIAEKERQDGKQGKK